MDAPSPPSASVFPTTHAIPPAPDYLPLPGTGFDPEPDALVREAVALAHRFAADVLRPAGVALDRMTPEEVAAPGSPYWQSIARYAELGFGLATLAELPPRGRAELSAMLYEELGWGDSGLAIAIGAGGLGQTMAASWQRGDLLARFPETMLGCWAITEPGAGSDMLDWDRRAAHPQGAFARPSLIATLRGDCLVLDGQKSAWVSNGPTAAFATVFTALDRGQGREGVNVYVPLDLPGVTRGKPLDKMGQRALPQGEIYFDHVEVPLAFVAAGPDQFNDAVYDTLCQANAAMGACFVGVARAAYEHALAYAHERRQGGVPIIRHQSVRARLFHMLRRVEAARALARRVFVFNELADRKALQAAIAAKITGTQTAFDVASDALQIFGGAGMARDYPMEKLLRDARAAMIEDGCNDLLAIKGGSLLIDPDRA